jgi:hypothetical protein
LCFTTEKTTATLHHGGDTLTCTYHHKTKIPAISCIKDSKTRTTHIPITSTLTQQPINKVRKRVMCHEPDQATTLAAYNLNLNTSKQELLSLHETYAHADTREIQQQIRNYEIKANRQVATCQIPKCLSCSKNKGKKRSHKQHRRSITHDDSYPGSNTSIYHVDAANVPGYTWQHKGRPTQEIQEFYAIFFTTKHAWYTPRFRNHKPHLKPVVQNATMRNLHNDTKSRSIHIMLTTDHSASKHFKKQLTTKTRNFTSVA